MGTIPQISVMRGPTPRSDLQHGHRLYKLFQQTAEKYPHHTAFIYEDGHGLHKQLTFSELEAKTNRLARALLKQIDEKSPNSDGDYIIALAVGASDTLVISLLATWKCGCAYLPLDSNAPPERVRHILAEARPVLVITETDEKEHLYKNVGHITYHKLGNIAANLPSAGLLDEEIMPCAEDPIEIVLYTSGSTGLSKGVRIRNSSVKNRLEWQWKQFPYAPDEQFCVFKTALTFVDSVSEIWGPLLHPGLPRTLIILPRDVTTNPQKLVAILEKYKVARLVLVPSLLTAILLYLGLSKQNQSKLQNLKLWVCSGETLSVALATQFFEHFNTGNQILCNFYGSTEIMGDVTFHIMKCTEDVSVDNKVPIGIPLDNTVLYLLDKDLRIVNSGEIGELYVSGRNLAAGYVNGRDAFRFIESPHTVDPDHKTLYKTGDYARIMKDMLIYEGRTDSQLKVRGHRVDLSEIDSALNQITGIDKGVALCYSPGEINQQILAFVLLEDEAKMSACDIELELARSLPKYALPQVLIVQKMPYLVNGKVDRQYLLNYFKQRGREENLLLDEFDFSEVPKGKEAIADCLYKTIISVLGNGVRSKISLKTNFYSIGGNSLNSVYTISKLRDNGYIISITDFISAKDLGEVLNKITHEDDADIAKIDNEFEKYTVEYMGDQHKEDVYRMIMESFAYKADIETKMQPPVQLHEYIPLLDGIWPVLIKQNVSIVARNLEGKVVGVSLVFDDDEEPEVDLEPPLSYVLEFLDYIEVPIRENNLPKGKRLHSFMLGTDQQLTPQENIEVTDFLEKKIIKLGKERGYIGIFATNTNPLTQQLAEVLNYKPIKTYQINQYVALNGQRPFKILPDSVVTVSSWKQF
uniref:Putative the adenylation domain of nonribosomal peptide synthetase n=1 Tax=Triatoma infestans TaxID=30076 RepID=A0A023F0N0_TRIIF